MMKKVLLLLSFLAAFFVSNAQYPVPQFIGRDSALVDSRGGLKARLILYSYADTASANLERISQYPWAIISTTSDSKLWFRNGFATGWVEVGSGGGGGGGVTTIATINGTTKSANGAVISGSNLYMQTVDGTYPGLMTSAQKARLDSNSYITIDKRYDSLAWRRNDSTFLMKSLRIQVNGGTITPTTTDSSLSYNVTGVSTDTTSLSTRINAKADTSALIVVDTTGATTGMEAYLDRTGGDTVKFRTATGGSGAFAKLEWFTGDEFAPAIGDSTMVHDSFSAKYLDIYRNGIKQPHIVGDTGWVRVNDTTIKVIPYFAANEFWHIEARDSTAYTQLVLQDPGGAPPSTTIAYVASTDGGNNGGSGTTRTFSHTTGSGSDRYLLVGFMGDVISGADDVTSVTYNGVSMTFIGKQGTSNTGNRFVYLYGLANPASGAHNVVITCASSHFILAAAAEYSGVQGVDTYTTADAFTTSKTTSITTGQNNCWTVLLGSTNNLVQSAGTGATKRAATTGDYVTFFDSNGAITPAGSYSMTTTCALGSGIGHIIVSLKPY